MQDGPIHTLHLSRQEFAWVLGALRHASATLFNCNTDTNGLGARDVFTDGGELEPASSNDLANFADRLNAVQPETRAGFCLECGERMQLDTVTGVATHTTEAGGVDHDRDAHHVPRLEHEYGEVAPAPEYKPAFNAKLFEQVLDEITANPEIWDQNQARCQRPCCFVYLLGSKTTRPRNRREACSTAASLLNLDRDAVEYLSQYTRDLADFKAFLACDGVPPLNWRDAEV